MDFIGVDYGSKLAGTTVICYALNDGLHFLQSGKGRDADLMLTEFIKSRSPGKVFIDAPLSLPGVYSGIGGDDYFYRKCDRDVKAMSPMFLGGLTARAIRLTHQTECRGISFYESYPRGLVDALSKNNPGLNLLYKQDLSSFTKMMVDHFRLNLSEAPKNWHQADALLAYVVGLRFTNGESLVFGDAAEGLIYV